MRIKNLLCALEQCFLPATTNNLSFVCQHFFCILSLFSKLTAGIGYNLTLLRSYLTDFKRRLTKRDHRRIQKNEAIKKHQMVRKSISKSGRVQVYLVVKKLFCFLQCNLGVLTEPTTFQNRKMMDFLVSQTRGRMKHGTFYGRYPEI